MDKSYQVFEPTDIPGEVSLAGQYATLEEARTAADAIPGGTVEFRDGVTASVVAVSD